MKTILKSLSALIVVSSTALAGSLDELPSNQKAAFVVAPGASHISVVKSPKFGNLMNYEVDVAFPAKKIIDIVSKQLGEKGWSPLKEDIFNPGMPSSHTRGWTHFLSQSGANVEQWLGQWKDKNGNFVNYAFRYEGMGTAPKSPLHVYAIFITAEAYATTMKEIKH